MSNDKSRNFILKVFPLLLILSFLIGYINYKTIRYAKADCLVNMTINMELDTVYSELVQDEQLIRNEKNKWGTSAALTEWYFMTKNYVIMFSHEVE